MNRARQERLDQLITEVPDHALRGAIRDALGLRRALPGNKELRDLMHEAVNYVNETRKLEQNERSKAAEKRHSSR
jgi:hypothetical protein